MINQDPNVPGDSTAVEAEAIVKAAIDWRWKLDFVDGKMTREEWQLAQACSAYGDVYKGLVNSTLNMREVKKYNKPAKAVEAMQFDGTALSAERIYDWISNHGQNWAVDTDEDGVYVNTIDGFVDVDVLQWVVRNNKGILSICQPWIFKDKYLEAQDY